MLWYLFIAYFTFVPTLCYDNNDDPSIVSTKYGQLKGVVHSDIGVRAFRGIPYAEPPIGRNRWKPTIPKNPWSDIYDATNFRACCVQDPIGENLTSSEDCLFMNVYTPVTAPPPNGFPVMFFIHGGAFEKGCSSQALFYGDFFANTSETILVTINYRLGALGFYTSPITGIPPNLGILDQIQALIFNQEIITDFGGDKNRITIFGQSAGAMSVVIHLVSPYTFQYNFFQQAIVESNPVSVKYHTVEESEMTNEIFSDLLGCKISDYDCFMTAPVEQIAFAQDYAFGIPTSPAEGLAYLLHWEPTLDGKILSEQPITLFSQGNFYKVPTIFGTCQNESAFWGYSIYNILNISSITPDEYVSFVVLFFQENTPSILELYPTSSDCTHSMFRLTTDYIFICPTRVLAKQTAYEKIPTWLYTFTWGSPDDFLNGNIPQCSENGTVCHAAELSFVWNTEGFYGIKRAPGEKNLEKKMLAAWTDFAHGRLDTSQWPQFNNETYSSLLWGIPTEISQNFDGHNCDYFDKIGYNW